jgi:subtilisin family serine protease
MKKVTILSILVGALFFGSTKITYSQSNTAYSVDSLDSKFLNWYNQSPKLDKIQGVEVNRAYSEILVSKTPKKKIVIAIIDSGVDIEHPDLQGKIWTNKNEIPNNGVDDDNNGYVDDIHGWGFLGNGKGENIAEENIEQTRIYRDLKPFYENIKASDSLNEKQKKEYAIYTQCKNSYFEELNKYLKSKQNIEAFEKDLNTVEGIIKNYLKRENYTVDDLKQINTLDERVMRAKAYLLDRYNNGFTHKGLQEYKDHISLYVDKHYNVDYLPRKIIGDNPTDLSDRNYGNNDVKGPRPDHGTPVSGVIAAVRNNGIGIDGIAENVELMILRAVPKGDERDKDIALAIRYAVDNGANIINMSFGKDFSPQKEFIDEAIKYASDQNVLMVHAAGNKAEDLDVIERYPTNRLDSGSDVQSWISVGANSIKLGKDLCGVFSNYGQTKVDLFAPGVDIISLAPEKKYIKTNGTSFSGPVVTGVAALVWSYYPELSALELKEILLESCTLYKNKKVLIPNLQKEKKGKAKFSNLSVTGGIVNAYNALKLAEIKVKAKI